MPSDFHGPELGTTPKNQGDLYILIGAMGGELKAQSKQAEETRKEVQEGNERQAVHAKDVSEQIVRLRVTVEAQDHRLIKVERTSKAYTDMQTRVASGFAVLSTLSVIFFWVVPVKEWLNTKIGPLIGLH